MVEAALVRSLAQEGYGVRFDWGPTAAATLAAGAGALVVVDVLSFTTSVSVATGRGISVIPFPLGGEGAADAAREFDAALAVRRAELSAAHPWSLSPRSLMDAPYTPRLLLPSPNGSAIAASVRSSQAAPIAGVTHEVTGDSSPDAPVVLAGCLRNVAATVAWLRSSGHGDGDRPVWLIAAGERWPDGTLRPAVEDHLGAGALARGLGAAGCSLSPEAESAARLFGSTVDLAGTVERCASGRELAAMGFPDEAAIASDLDADDHASLLAGAMFVRD